MKSASLLKSFDPRPVLKRGMRPGSESRHGDGNGDQLTERAEKGGTAEAARSGTESDDSGPLSSPTTAYSTVSFAEKSKANRLSAAGINEASICGEAITKLSSVESNHDAARCVNGDNSGSGGSSGGGDDGDDFLISQHILCDMLQSHKTNDPIMESFSDYLISNAISDVLSQDSDMTSATANTFDIGLGSGFPAFLDQISGIPGIPPPLSDGQTVNFINEKFSIPAFSSVNNNPHRRVLSMPVHAMSGMPGDFSLLTSRGAVQPHSAMPGPRSGPNYTALDGSRGGLGINNGNAAVATMNSSGMPATSGLSSPIGSLMPRVASYEGAELLRDGHRLGLGGANGGGAMRGQMVLPDNVRNLAEPNNSGRRPRQGGSRPALPYPLKLDDLVTGCQSAPVTPSQPRVIGRGAAQRRQEFAVQSAGFESGAGTLVFATPPRKTQQEQQGGAFLTDGNSKPPMSPTSPTSAKVTPHRVDRQLAITQRPLLFVRPKNKHETPRKRRRRCMSSDAAKTLNGGSSGIMADDGRGSSNDSEAGAADNNNRENMSCLQWQRISEQRRRDAMRENFDLLKRMLPTEYMHSDDGRELARPVLLARFLRWVDDKLIEMETLRSELARLEVENKSLKENAGKQQQAQLEVLQVQGQQQQQQQQEYVPPLPTDGIAPDWIWNPGQLSMGNGSQSL
ncbi:hypothetical protein EV182_003802, partial [Spiromyces aspiralis]